jgi:hypothetical protein
MSNVATVFGVMGKSLGLLPNAVAARTLFNVIRNQNQFKIGATGSQFKRPINGALCFRYSLGSRSVYRECSVVGFAR